MKAEIRVLGIDDGPFKKGSGKDVLVVGTFFRGGTLLDGILSTKVRVDGRNATAKLSEMINRSKWQPQIQCILLDGVALGGFNVVDTQRLHKETGIAVMTVMRDVPDYPKIINALRAVGKPWLLKVIESAGAVHSYKKIHFQAVGLTLEKAHAILGITCTRSDLPEPIRVAHIIAAGITDGESRGRA